MNSHLRLWTRASFALLLLGMPGLANAQTIVSLENVANVYPDDPTMDSRDGINAAIQAAISGSTGTPNPRPVVAFEADRTYYVSSTESQTVGGPEVFLLDGVQDLHIQGNRSRLVRTLAAGDASLGSALFFIRDCANIEIEDLTIDYDPLPYVDCVVTSVQPNAFEALWVRGIKDANKLTQFDSDPNVKRFGIQLDPTTPGLVKRASRISVFASSITSTTVDPTGETLFSFSGGSTDMIEIGDRISYHVRKGNTFHIVRPTLVTIRNVKAYGSSHFFASISGPGSGVKIEKCDVQVKGGRWRSINGDGVHAFDINDIDITDCYFQGLTDDGVHIKQCSDFSVLNNTFVGIRGFAVTLDGDGKLNSKDGCISGNSGYHLSGSFVRHFGGAYSDSVGGEGVIIAGNVSASNNRMEHGNRTRCVRLISAEDPTLAIGIQTDALTGDPLADTALVLVDRDSDTALWDLSSCVGSGNTGCCAACSKHDILTSSYARELGVWLSVGASNSNGPIQGSQTSLEEPTQTTVPYHVDQEFQILIAPMSAGSNNYHIQAGDGVQMEGGSTTYINRNPNLPGGGMQAVAAVGDILTYRTLWVGPTFELRQQWILEVVDRTD